MGVERAGKRQRAALQVFVGQRGALPATSGLEVSEIVCTSSLCLEESRERG